VGDSEDVSRSGKCPLYDSDQVRDQVVDHYSSLDLLVLCGRQARSVERLKLYMYCHFLLLQRAKLPTKREMTQFYSDEYIDFFSRITPSHMNSYMKEQHKCKWFLLASLAPLTFYRR